MLSLRELLLGICLRPAMYVANGSFPEVAAFIDGFDCGRFPDGTSDREMVQFGRWLARRFDYPDLGWSHCLLRICGDDPQFAFARLVPFFDEFIAERGANAHAIAGLGVDVL